MAEMATDRLLQVLRNGTPGVLALVFVFVSLLPFGFPGSAQIVPPLALMAVFHWGIYRPDLLPGVLAFALGLTQDIVSGGPLGMWAAAYLVVHAVMASQRRFFLGKKFVVEWLGFALVAPAVFLCVWLVGSAYVGRLADPLDMLLQALLAVMLYPVLSWLMSAVRRVVGGI